MNQTSAIAILVAAFVGIVAIAGILARRDREARYDPSDSFVAASTEGETICRNCGMGNLVGDARCVACGAELPRHRAPPVA